MQASIAPERPAYVVFETRPLEDRTGASEGRLAYRDVDYAIITPMGSKDRLERVVSEWFTNLEAQVRAQRFDPSWLAGYKEAYKAWKEDREAPVSGTSLRDWPVLSPGQIKSLMDLRLRTVEDLAGANEETLSRIGMGARTLQQKAQNWLTMARESAPVEEITNLRQQNKDLTGQVQSLVQQIRDLQGIVNQLRPIGRGQETQAAADDDEEMTPLEKTLGSKL